MSLSFKVGVLFCCAIFMAISVSADVKSDDPCNPNQIHTALGEAYYNVMFSETGTGNTTSSNATAVIVWQTKDVCNDTYIYVTADNMKTPLNYTPELVWNEMINSTIDLAENNDSNSTGSYTSYSHTAILNLEPGHIYNYNIYQLNGTNSAGPFTLRLPILDSSNEQIRVGIYSDIDTRKANDTLDFFNNMSKKNINYLDAQLCLGDLAYDLYSESGKRGEYFFNTAQPALSTWPFMISPGNHEYYKNYSFLNFRTRMPLYNQSQNQYYSFNLGKIHFISVNMYVYDSLMDDQQDAFFQWLKDDLVMANKNRANRPWIVVYTHQPLYCSFSSPDDKERKRCYYMYGMHQIFDELYHDQGVDIVLQAHVHYWERMKPIYKNESVEYNSWSDEVKSHYFINSSAPIYTVEGSAGNGYFMLYKNNTKLANYSLIVDDTLGFSTLSTVNSSALYYEHINSTDGSVIDYFYVLKGAEYQISQDPDDLNPVDPTPVDPTPVDPTPVDPTPDDPTPVDPTPADPTSDGSTPADTPSSNAWLIALILVFVAGVIGLLVYRKYRLSQASDLEKAINQEKQNESYGVTVVH